MFLLRASLKALGIALLMLSAIAVLGLLQTIGKTAWLSAARVMVYRLTMRITGMTLSVNGEIAPAPVLLVSNHCSYLDVILMGSLRDICFTPKSDVRSWPVIGLTVALFGSVFVSRNPRDAKQVQEQIFTALRSHRPLSLFPEGTTNNGRSLFPFKPSMFNLAHVWDGAEQLTIQPVSLRYASLNGQPMEGDDYDKVAWYGDIDFFPHLWQLLQQRSVHAHLTFHPPLAYDADTHRKTLARQAEDIVRQGLGLAAIPTEDA
jgi:1-acyl-sn-glycerol-3-phosphate acyltransferase